MSVDSGGKQVNGSNTRRDERAKQPDKQNKQTDYNKDRG